MWGTSQGDRTLIGGEADLVRKSVGYLRDMITAGIDLNEPYRSEVNVFCRLQPTQQLATLHEVAYGLLDPLTPIIELTAVREGTVYAIYRELVSLIEIEIELARNGGIFFQDMVDSSKFPGRPKVHGQLEFEPEFQMRATVVSTCNSIRLQSNEWSQDGWDAPDLPGQVPPETTSENLVDWFAAIEFLSNQVLWDRDFEMEAIFADHDPAEIADIKSYLGIHENYFSTPAPDAYSDEFQRIDHELVLLTKNQES